jgi:tRNA (guanosine-2'-O-)-methyltransferase
LRKNGYKIIVTSSHKNDCTIEELDITSKTALFFGTEMRGATSVAFEHADGFVKIPMVGFTESLNISVAAAITLYTLTSRLRKSTLNWHLTPAEQLEIRLQWLKNSIPKSEILIKEFRQKS